MFYRYDYHQHQQQHGRSFVCHDVKTNECLEKKHTHTHTHRQIFFFIHSYGSNYHHLFFRICFHHYKSRTKKNENKTKTVPSFCLFSPFSVLYMVIFFLLSFVIKLLVLDSHTLEIKKKWKNRNKNTTF